MATLLGRDLTNCYGFLRAAVMLGRMNSIGSNSFLQLILGYIKNPRVDGFAGFTGESGWLNVVWLQPVGGGAKSVI